MPPFEITSSPTGPRMRVRARGVDVLRNPLVNRGSAFTYEERRSLEVDGFLPPEVDSLDVQVDRVYASFQREGSALAKYQFLRALQDRNETLFYALLSRYVEEMLPIVYTPTVGEAIRQYSGMFRVPRGLTFSPLNVDRAGEILASYPLSDVRMIVATDSSAILGIGDQGYGGIAISIGKLALYTLGGLPPWQALPVSLDVGTDREDLLADPLYLGVRRRRMRGDEYLALVDRFVAAVSARFPEAIVQWEDLAKDTAFDVLARYRDRQPSFNDDVQGTGAVALAGLMRASTLAGRRLVDQVFVVHGAGAGGIGVAQAIRAGLVRAGLADADARARVFVLDSKGLLMEGRAMEAYKQPFAKPREAVAGWSVQGERPTLLETIVGAKATALLGLSGQGGAFDAAVVRALAANAERPIVFPLSNPTASSEVLPKDALFWTDGRALVATGSPFEPVAVGGRAIAIGQGNNAFVFPGIGLGASLARARRVSDAMVLEAATTLAELTARLHPDRLYPPVAELGDVALAVAARVFAQAGREGLAAVSEVPANIEEYVKVRAYAPRYLPVDVG